MIEVKYIEIEDFIEIRSHSIIIDVRTPIEHEKGHIPETLNIPIFLNDDRVKVGTLYRQKGRKSAILKGLELVGPRLAEIVKQVEAIAEKNVIIHCWRGGLRSYTMSWLLNLYGIPNKVLRGGYKAYRQHLKKHLSQNANIWVLGGMTGTGKTEILKILQDQGNQVVDLESLAHHRGSAFGKIHNDKQLSNEQFENLLGEQWLTLNLSQPIWVEDEGKAIGGNFIPDELFSQIRKSKVIKVDVPLKQRINRLIRDYTSCGKDILIQNIHKIEKRLGRQNAIEAIEAVKNDNLYRAVEIVLYYYDKAYNYGLSKREVQSIFEITLDNTNLKESAKQVFEFQKTVSNGRN